MSKSIQADHKHQPCNLQRAKQFLNSDHYQLEDDELIEHLDSCATCRAFMDSQAAEPEVWDNLSTLLKPGEFDEAGKADYSAATIGQLGQKPVAAQDVLDSLAPTDDPHHLGRLGTYEVTGVVGVGGMGVVLKAVDPSLDRVVAIKVMAPQLANNEQARKRFAREAKAAAAVIHPNVIPIHSVNSETSLPYLVMSYIRGGSLQKRLEQQGPLQIVEVLRIGSQIAEGLAAAHDQGLVHRDIKPENILLEEGVERVTITDFGLARAVDDNTVTQQGTIAGTPTYMSPEQARGERLDQQSDLFSLGSLLYALCTGHPPYRSDSSFGVMRKIIDEDAAPIQELNPDIPDWLGAIVSKLMSKDKSDRFQRAADVHELLEACLSHVQQPEAIPLPVIPGGSRRQRSRPFLKSPLGIFTMATLVSAAVFLGVLVLQSQPQQGEPSLAVGIDDQVETTRFDILEINQDLAERLIGRKEHLTFTKLKSLSPEVATILARTTANLSFPAVEQIAPETAKALATKKALWLDLGGLRELSPEVAQELGEAQCAVSLDGVREITPEVAASLVRGNATRRLGLSSISPAVAAQLAEHTGWLSLPNLRAIGPESAAALAKHKHWLSLDGLETLTPELAAALGNFNGDKLDLNGLQTLDLETAGKLATARCQSGLYLNGLTSVSPEVVSTLANGNSMLSFQGLQEIDDATIQALEAASQKLQESRKVLMVNKDLTRTMQDKQLTADEIVRRLTKKHGNLVSKLQKLVSEAAGVPNAQWRKFAADPSASADAIQGEPLSLILWKINPLEAAKQDLLVLSDFQYLGGIPKPTQLSEAMFPSQVYGYYSMIQPHYISGLTYELKRGTMKGRTLAGNFRFQCPQLYAGKIDFVVQVGQDDELRVVKFALPNYGITVARGNDGLWHQVERPASSNQAAPPQLPERQAASQIDQLHGGRDPFPPAIAMR